MSYAETIDEAIVNCKHQTVFMQRCLSQNALMDALKHTSIMLTELRNPALSPKQYYELYILCFDSLSLLSNYLVESHPKKHHLADLYELVQYAGNILPRLYLMITVGSSYLQSPDAPREEILKDMIEMCRGVQNPIRGLFLRYYLSQRTKPFLDNGLVDKKFSISFIISNFVEMNKLWVRLQHQGPLKEREQRTRERKELQILIGANLVRLSQIVENDVQLYQAEVLPSVLEQVVQCRDVVSQEYLLDVICQVFPDEFHLVTLSSLLDTTLKLNPEVAINKVVLNLVERLNGYLERKDGSLDADITSKLSSLDITDNDKNLFFVFWSYLNQISEERPDVSVLEFSPLIQSIMRLTLQWYPGKIANIETLFKFLYDKCKDYGKALPQEWDNRFEDVFFSEAITSDPEFFYEVLTKCEFYQKLLALQSKTLQKVMINKILDYLLSHDVRISVKAELEKVLLICEPLTTHQPQTPAETQSDALQLTANTEPGLDDWLSHPDQEKLVKLVHLCYSKSIKRHADLLLCCKASFHKGGKNMRFTYSAIICTFWKLIRRAHLKSIKKPARAEKLRAFLKQMFKFISRCANELFNVCGASCVDMIYKLHLETASLADQLSLSEIAYDFFTQAFTIFEDSLSDSRTQFQGIVNMAQALQKTRSLYDDSYYDTLITRCTLHGSKLLRKQDQCRAVYLCSHLWWATEISLLGEEEGVTESFFREGKRVLECLQRSLRVADSIMDSVQSCHLMIEILNRCCYYFIHGEEQSTHVGTKYINGLIELITTNIDALKLEEPSSENDLEPSQALYFIGPDGTYLHLPSNNSVSIVTTKPPAITIAELISIPTQYFQRTLDYIHDQKDVDVRFKAINA